MSIETKSQLRRELRAARRAFVSVLGTEARIASFGAAPPALAALIERARSVAVYIAMGDEADPAGIAELSRRAGREIGLPRLEPMGGMAFAAWNGSNDQLARGQLGIPEPFLAAAALIPDLIVTPLLGFDRAMGRIGQGKGYYDRAFVRYPKAFRLGLAWSTQEVAELPMEAWDMRLHAVLTEREWIVAS